MRRTAWVVALLPLLGACDGLGPEDFPTSLLEANEARWDSLGPPSYVYAVARDCFCPIEYRGPVRVTVVSGVVVDRVYAESGLAVPAGFADGFPSVDGLFDLLRDALEREADEVRVTYDPDLGVPIDFWIDYLQMAADEEMGMRVTEAVDPLP